MTDQPSDDQIDTANERGRALVDELYAALGQVCDRQTSYLSAMQILMARSGLEVQEALDCITSLLAHNLCDDRPIRLALVPVEAPPAGTTKH